jgi:hypothetical protein
MTVACGSTPATSDGSDAGCPTGTVQKFDPDTGKPFCQSASDAGTVGGTTDGGSTGGGAGGSDGGSTSSDGGASVGDTGAKPGGPNASFECPIKPLNPAGLEHGKACTQDSECMYGNCYFGPPAAGYDPKVGVCTKNCACAGKDAPCSTDGVDKYTCAFERTANDGNPKRTPANGIHKMCLRICKSDDDCLAWNPALPHCINSDTPFMKYGVMKYCALLPK